MARDLDEFAAELTQVTTAAIRAASTTTKARALITAARTGNETAVRRIANTMSTAELKAVKKQLER